MKNKITVIGAGSWGTALAQVLCDNGQDVTIYAIEEDVVEDININHKNSKFFDDVLLPENLHATSNLDEALKETAFILLVVPTKVIRGVLAQINAAITSPVTIINASKGIEPGTYKRVSEVASEEMDADKLASFVALSGPSHAEEVIVRQITSVTCAADEEASLPIVQNLFKTDYFRVYRTPDLLGVELGGSIKNVIALASGVLAGLGYGDNTRALLITRGLAEMKRMGVALGAREETFSGLSGIGDLIVTATSQHSRNFQAGYKIGSGSNLQESLDSMTMVVEGVRTCQATYELAKKMNIEMPIVETLYEVIFNKLEPRTAIATLMKRAMKDESQ